MTMLTRGEGIQHLLGILLVEDPNMTIRYGRAFHKPHAEALYDIFTNTTPQQRFPQHGANLIRINANHNQVTEAFLNRQYKLWTSRQWAAGLANVL